MLKAQAHTVGAILAGGRGARMGGGKPHVLLGGKPMIAHIAAILRATVTRLAVVGDPAAATLLDAEPLADAAPDAIGPLSGMTSALEWAAAEDAEWLAVLPCDAPLLPMDVVQRLLHGAGDASLAYAVTPGGPQPLVSIWRPDLAPLLRDALDRHPPVRDLMDSLGAARVCFQDETSFFNVNTPADLARAEELLSLRTPAPARQPPRS